MFTQNAYFRKLACIIETITMIDIDMRFSPLGLLSKMPISFESRSFPLKLSNFAHPVHNFSMSVKYYYKKFIIFDDLYILRYYVCAMKKTLRCPVTARQHLNGEVVTSGHHNHEPPVPAELDVFKNILKDRACNETISLRTIYVEEAAR